MHGYHAQQRTVLSILGLFCELTLKRIVTVHIRVGPGETVTFQLWQGSTLATVVLCVYCPKLQARNLLHAFPLNTKMKDGCKLFSFTQNAVYCPLPPSPPSPSSVLAVS